MIKKHVKFHYISNGNPKGKTRANEGETIFKDATDENFIELKI